MSDNKRTKVSNDELYESSNASPPPLPPRSARSSADLSPTSLKLMPGVDYAECNGDVCNSECVISEVKQTKHEPVATSEKNRLSCSSAVGEGEVNLPSPDESSGKSPVSSGSERYICILFSSWILLKDYIMKFLHNTILIVFTL